MNIKSLAYGLIVIILINLACYVFPPPPITEKGPTVRIGIGENLASVAFQTRNEFDILDQNGRILARGVPGGNWSVKLEDAEPVTLRYKLLYREVESRDNAEQIIASLNERGHSATIKQINKKMVRNGEIGNEAFYQVLLQPTFNSEDEAAQYQSQLRGRLGTTVLPFFESRPKGKIILTNEDTGARFQSSALIRVQGNLFVIKMITGEGYHFEKEEQRTYRRGLEFWIDRFGKLTVVNEIPVETYLRGVVGSEMHRDFPLEALKAQAVTARSFTLARIGKQHRLSPFDFCDEVHCHVYGGVDRETTTVNEAVERTRGQVLMYNDIICEAYYAGVCGGHTENNENVWSAVPLPYLRGTPDATRWNKPQVDDLTDEAQARRWIESSPEVYCNTTQKAIPEYLSYTRGYFRWSVRYSRDQLGAIIARKTGQNLGTLLQIVPLERGVSGRLKKVKLSGSRQSLIVERELEIRRVLAPDYLYSSCFIIDQVGNDLILKGAGWGHGVGMCQTGAAMMALDGADYREILNHYYNNSSLTKLY